MIVSSILEFLNFISSPLLLCKIKPILYIGRKPEHFGFFKRVNTCKKQVTKMMISISKKGHDMLLKHLDNKGFVRITIKNGGCSGMTYDAHIVPERDASEKIVYHERGITVITDETSLPYLQGLNIDYSDDLISAGFRFNNSSNESSCGCGGSFSVVGFPQFSKGGMNGGS